MQNFTLVFIISMMFSSIAFAKDVASGNPAEQNYSSEKPTLKSLSIKEIRDCLMVSNLYKYDYSPGYGLYKVSTQDNETPVIVETDGKYPGLTKMIRENKFVNAPVPCAGNELSCNQPITDQAEIQRLNEAAIQRIKRNFLGSRKIIEYYLKTSPFHKTTPFLIKDEVEDFRNSMCMCQDYGIARKEIEDAKKQLINVNEIKVKDYQGVRMLIDEDFACDYSAS